VGWTGFREDSKGLNGVYKGIVSWIVQKTMVTNKNQQLQERGINNEECAKKPVNERRHNRGF